VALTRRQREIYDYICSFIDANGYSPSLEEIGAQFRLSSVATVHKHVAQLVEKGWLRKTQSRSRSVEPIPRPTEANGEVTLPLLGVVAAGTPIEPIEDPESIQVPQALAGRPGERFVLRVRGDSMIGEQIRDGDYVVVEARTQPREGDTVVAVLRGEEATLKKFQRRADTVRLLPANPALRPIEAPAAEVEVRGVVRGLLRRY